MSSSFDYTLSDIEASLAGVGVTSGDVVFVQSSLGMLGRPEDASNIEEVCDLLDQALHNVVGETGTIVVPTYTYSFCEGKSFNPVSTPSTIGPFAEFYRQKPDTTRSSDPIFSVAAAGPCTSDIILGLPQDCFGLDSVYDRLCALDAIIVTVGLGMEYATFRHHAEQMARIPSRFLKAFPGIIEDKSKNRDETWLYYVPALIKNCEASGRAAAIKARDSNVAKSVNLGRNQVWGARAAGYRAFLIEQLKQDPWFTSKGPVVDVIVEERNRAMVVRSKKLQDAPYIVSADARHAIDTLATRFDLNVQTWRTGERFGNWVVPENWQLHDAAIKINGSEALTFGGDFWVSGNSASVSKKLIGTELRSHLNRRPKNNADWALYDIDGCLSGLIDDDEIMVTIDATKSLDQLSVAGTQTDSPTHVIFLCLSADTEVDAVKLDTLIELSNRNNGCVYVLPSPVAAIPVIANDHQQTDFYFAEYSPDWADVKATLNRDGFDIEFLHFQSSTTSLKEKPHD